MSEEHGAEEHTHHGNYVKIWAILSGLLAISVAGPMLEIQLVTLITAFGVACVKAYMVAKHFMHITVAQRYITYLVTTCLVFMLLFFAGVAPDVMESKGDNWQKNLDTWLYSPSPAHHASEGHGAGGH